MIKCLLKRHRYPPEGMDDAVQTVMTQCELWTDNNDMAVTCFPQVAAMLVESNMIHMKEENLWK